MRKLIKISDSHYIVVDDSEIKENNWYCNNKVLFLSEVFDESNNPNQNKNNRLITHSTQPLEGTFSSILYKGYNHISLSEVEELINGYSLEKIAENRYPTPVGIYKPDSGYLERRNIWKEGFNTHKELVKDKLFTVEDMEKALVTLISNISCEDGKLLGKSPEKVYKWITFYIKSLLPKTEWDCKVVNGKIELV